MSWITVWCLFGLALLLIYLKKGGQYFGVGIIILMSALRWDVGNDYPNYYDNIQSAATQFHEYGMTGFPRMMHGFEIAMALLVYIFHWVKDPAPWVIATFSAFTILMWYKSLKRINGLFLGFFSILFFGILFNSWDQIRQAAAISVFLYSIRYIEEENLPHYLLCCILAFLIHNSAFIVIPLYFVKKINLKPWMILTICGVFLILYIKGFWEQQFSTLFSSIEIYEKYVGNKMSGQEFTSNTGAIIKTAIYVALILGIYKENRSIGNILLFGTLIYLFSCSNELILRIANYGTSAIMLALPIYFKIGRKQIERTIGYGIITLMFLIGTKNASIGEGGCTPYDSLLSQNYINREFRIRQYML